MSCFTRRSSHTKAQQHQENQRHTAFLSELWNCTYTHQQLVAWLRRATLLLGSAANDEPGKWRTTLSVTPSIHFQSPQWLDCRTVVPDRLSVRDSHILTKYWIQYARLNASSYSSCSFQYDTIRYDTIEEFNVDWKAEYGQLNLA